MSGGIGGDDRYSGQSNDPGSAASVRTEDADRPMAAQGDVPCVTGEVPERADLREWTRRAVSRWRRWRTCASVLAAQSSQVGFSTWHQQHQIVAGRVVCRLWLLLLRHWCSPFLLTGSQSMSPQARRRLWCGHRPRTWKEERGL
jgi:hypothetical protein